MFGRTLGCVIRIFSLSLIGPTQDGLDLLKVSHLLLPDEKKWNTHFIQSTMIPSHMELVLNVPLFVVTVESVFWWHIKDGNYSVKSAYNIFMERIVDLSHHHCIGEWDVIWKMKIPQKIKIELAGIYYLCGAISKRMESFALPCVFSVYCSSAMENSWHCFVKCPGSVQVWRHVGLWIVIEPVLLDKAESFPELFFQVYCVGETHIKQPEMQY